MEHPDTEITPDDATPNEDVDLPEPPEPDPEHVVEESGRED
jgi:hypothetical protein